MELKKKEYGEYVEKITPKNSLPADMARRSHLQSGAGYDNGPDVTGRPGKGNGSDVDSAGADFSQHSSDRSESVSQGGKMGRCRGPGTDYRLCQFCCGSSHRIQGRRPCIWYWLQDFYHCRAGDFVWDICQLDPGADCLDRGLVRREAHAEGKS